MLMVLLSVVFFQSGRVDAALVWKNGKMYTFSGDTYVRYDLGKNAVDPGYPRPIAGNWPGLPFQRVDAAVNWQNGKAYFFSGAYYVRYDIATDRVDPGYPKTIQDNWSLPWPQVDAAFVRGPSGPAYFFNNATGTYVRYQLNARTPEAGYPKQTRALWTALSFAQIDAAFATNQGIYFTQGGVFQKLNLADASFLNGYPKALSWLPDAAGVSYNPGSVAPPKVSPPPALPGPGSTGCRVNGSFATLKQDGYGNSGWQPVNNLTVNLQQAGGQFQARYNQLLAMGYDGQGALGIIVNEDGYWQNVAQTITKPAEQHSSKYGYAYSWFGFVNVAPGYYRITISGYPRFNRWLRFTAGGQSLDVVIENR